MKRSLIGSPLIGALAGALALSSLHVAPAQAATPMSAEPAVSRRITVAKDKTLAFRLAEPASRIVVAQSDIAQVVPTSDRTFYVRGKEIGSTNLLVYGPGGRVDQVIDVDVAYDASGLQDALGMAFPGERIQVRNAGQGLLLTGQVSSTGVATRAGAIAEQAAKGFVINNLTARASQEVILEVRVLEASRSVLHDMGVTADIHNNSFQFLTTRGLVGSDGPNGVLGLFGGVGKTTIDVALEALENKGLVHTLARPNLVAISGEKASFLAGGEYPFPVPQSANGSSTTITIEFREYGVKLDFRPVVQDNGLIRLEVAPEVSQLDPTNSLRINGYTVPGLITRRTSTTVELRDGAALAIGGLFQRNYQNNISQVPGIGDIPVLGALFRSTRWQNNETELVIIVTPRMATPADFAAARTASVNATEPTVRDMLLRGDNLGKAPPAPAPAPVPAPAPAPLAAAVPAPVSAPLAPTKGTR
ncbi:type II and III secretion system protein family protein [Phenylobacterium soli]|nr:type II and III secretion system protein family protein [Phenylobacterium soli]